MNLRAIPVVALIFVWSSTCCAAKFFHRATPNGKTFTVERLKGDRLRFTITRDPANTSHSKDPDIVIRRSGHLRITKGDQNIFSARIEPVTNKAGHLTYSFILSEELAASAVFRLSEIEDYRRGGGYMGGGWIAEYALPSFPGFNENLDPFADP